MRGEGEKGGGGGGGGGSGGGNGILEEHGMRWSRSGLQYHFGFSPFQYLT